MIKQPKRVEDSDDEMEDGSSELSRSIPDGYPLDPEQKAELEKFLSLLLRGHKIISKALHMFTILPAPKVTPDGLLGGKGFIMSLNDIKALLAQMVHGLSQVEDCITDELTNPAWDGSDPDEDEDFSDEESDEEESDEEDEDSSDESDDEDESDDYDTEKTEFNPDDNDTLSNYMEMFSDDSDKSGMFSLRDIESDDTSGMDDFLSGVRPSKQSTRKVASSELKNYQKVGATLVHKSSKDLWEVVSENKDSIVIRRLFDDAGAPLKC